jgi:hypothetical protein
MFHLAEAITVAAVTLQQDPVSPVLLQEVTRLPVAPQIQEAVTVAVATVAVEAQAQEAVVVEAVVNVKLIEKFFYINQ